MRRVLIPVAWFALSVLVAAQQDPQTDGGFSAVSFGLSEVLVWVLPAAIVLGGLAWFLHNRAKGGR